LYWRQALGDVVAFPDQTTPELPGFGARDREIEPHVGQDVLAGDAPAAGVERTEVGVGRDVAALGDR
jgi:hypothetical protein